MNENSVNPQLNIHELSVEQLSALIIMAEEAKFEKTYSKESLVSFNKEYLSQLKGYASNDYITSVALTMKYLLEYFGEEKLLCDITRNDANKIVAWLRDKAPKGYRIYYRNLKAAFNFAFDCEYIKANPFLKVKLPTVQKEAPAYITPNQLKKILVETHSDTLRAIFHFTFYSGCRRKEVLNLRWRNVDFGKKQITIGDCDFQTKNKKVRIVPMCEELYSKLWEWSGQGKKSIANPDCLVFAKSNGFSYHKDVPTKCFKQACRKATVDEKVHFHSLRHSFASFLVQNGTDLYSVKNLLGHNSITTTEIYAHLNIEALQESIKVFDNAK